MRLGFSFSFNRHYPPAALVGVALVLSTIQDARSPDMDCLLRTLKTHNMPVSTQMHVDEGAKVKARFSGGLPVTIVFSSVKQFLTVSGPAPEDEKAGLKTALAKSCHRPNEQDIMAAADTPYPL